MNRGGIQLCVKTLQMTMTTTQAVKCRRLAGPKSLLPKKNAMERHFFGRDTCDEKNSKKNQKNKNSQTALLPNPRWCSASDGADRHQLVCLEVTSRCRDD